MRYAATRREREEETSLLAARLMMPKPQWYSMYNTGYKNYPCDKCERKFGRKSHFLLHHRTVHENRKDFACDKCQRKFGQKVNLLVHQKITVTRQLDASQQRTWPPPPIAT
uniref:C2H2-type domain-containing protein n=1 Tax=Trichogramma kaykai TaxID=54128 RepID=A0ABD2X7K7_9HYME